MRAASGSGGTALSRSAAGQERLIQICGRAGPPCPDLRPGGTALSRSAAGRERLVQTCGRAGTPCPDLRPGRTLLGPTAAIGAPSAPPPPSRPTDRSAAGQRAAPSRSTRRGCRCGRRTPGCRHRCTRRSGWKIRLRGSSLCGDIPESGRRRLCSLTAPVAINSSIRAEWAWVMRTASLRPISAFLYFAAS